MEGLINWDVYFPMPNERNKERLLHNLSKLDDNEIDKVTSFFRNFEEKELDTLMTIHAYRVENIKGELTHHCVRFKWHPDSQNKVIIVELHMNGVIELYDNDFGCINWISLPRNRSYDDTIRYIKLLTYHERN